VALEEGDVLGDPALEPEDFDVREYFARFSYDGLDDVNFPRRGQSLRAEWRGERRDLGSEEPRDVLDGGWDPEQSTGQREVSSAGQHVRLVGDGTHDVVGEFQSSGELDHVGACEREGLRTDIDAHRTQRFAAHDSPETGRRF
jgi:hypothetical protein